MKHAEKLLFRKKGLLKPAARLTLALSMIIGAHDALALDPTSLIQTWDTSSKNPDGSLLPIATTFGSKSTPSWGYPNVGIPSDGTPNLRIQMNYWNQDEVGGNVTQTSLTANVTDKTAGTFTVVPNVAADAPGISTGSYWYPGSRPQDNKSCASASNTQDECHWAPNSASPSSPAIHAPAAYPSIYNGCAYGQCSTPGKLKDGTTTVAGAPYPIQANQITSIPSHWVVDTSTSKATGIYDVAYDIWLDKNTPRDTGTHKYGSTTLLPTMPDQLWQNDGTEIMIWINNKGYVSGGTTVGGTIQPAGNLLAQNATIPGISGTWDVWVTNGRPGSADKGQPSVNKQYAISWYVVSYVRNQGVDDFEFDSKWFITHAASLDCYKNMTTKEKCAQPSWWLTSIQAGFEIWADGEGLSSKSFTAKPTWVAGTQQGGRTTVDGGGNTIPLVYWGDSFQVTATCPNPNPGDTGTWSFLGTDPTTGISYPQSGALAPDATGVLVGTVKAPYPAHGPATVNVTTTCVNGGGGVQPVINIYIDPAGSVKDTNGKALVGVPATLYRSDTANGTFTVVPDGSTIMSPNNRKNPSKTGQQGDFSWDVSAGFYKVRAQAPGCYKPGTPSQNYVESAVYQVPPPALGINLVLECPASGGNNGVNVQLTVNGADWQTGYCRNVVLTNNTSKAIAWKVNFNLPYPGNVTQAWNINYTKSGNVITAQGVGWNNVIQPGQVLKDQGFCATK
jgi:Cellulose binding domain